MTRSTQRPILSLMLLLLLVALGVSGCGHTGATTRAERVRIDRVVLLSTEAQMSANLTVEQLAAFIREAQAQLAQNVAPDTPALRLIVQFTLQPHSSQIVKITRHDGAHRASRAADRRAPPGAAALHEE